MKKYVKANSGDVVVKATYSMDLDSSVPNLRSMTVKGTDLKETLMNAVDLLALPYLGLDWEDPDSFDMEDLIDAIQYNNDSRNESYIFYLEINGKPIIDNVEPEENY